MAWKKSSPELVDAFYAALPDDPRVERRKMFGYPCAFVNGNMFSGLHEHRMVVRLPEEQRDALVRLPGATRFEPMKGRVMKEYVVVPDALLGRKTSLRPWVRKAFEHAAALPAKKKKPKTSVAASRKAKRG